MTNVAIFASGEGTNCENIIRHFAASADINIGLVLANKPTAAVLQRAAKLGVETAVVDRKSFSDPSVIIPLLDGHSIDFIILAGFLLMIPDFLVTRYHHRMINLHPSLLPKHGGRGMYGRHVHEAVKLSGDAETGMTIHWVSSECDGGDIIAQYSVPLSPSDTVDDIAAKEHRLEMKYFPAVIEAVIKGKEVKR